MKLNTRTLGIVAGLAVVATSYSADPWSFKVAYGDAATAALNGKAVGDVVNEGDVIKIGQIGAKVVFQLLVDVDPAANVGSFCGFIGLDQSISAISGSKTYSNYAALVADAVGGAPLSAMAVNTAVGLPGVDNNNDPVDVDVAKQAEAYVGVAGSGTVSRRIGKHYVGIFGTGLKWAASAGTHRLLDWELTNESLGDGKSHMLSINQVAAATSRANFLAIGTARPLDTKSTNFTVQAVPEPGTMIAIGAGLAALAARKRRKS